MPKDDPVPSKPDDGEARDPSLREGNVKYSSIRTDSDAWSRRDASDMHAILEGRRRNQRRLRQVCKWTLNALGIWAASFVTTGNAPPGFHWLMQTVKALANRIPDQ